MLLIALIPTLILSIVNLHLYSIILDLQAKIILLENKVVHEHIVAVEKTPSLNLELILIGVSSVVLLFLVFK